MAKVKLSKTALSGKSKFDESKIKRDATGKFDDKPGAGDDAPSLAPKVKAKISGDDEIKVLVPSNPKKPGSKSHANFEKYKDSPTVDAYIKNVGDKKTALADIAWDTKKGFVTVAPPPPKPVFGPVKESGVSGKDKIQVLAAGNPKKPGSASHDNFAKYKNGGTVDDYVAAVGDKKKAMADIAWDKKKGFISVHDADGAASPASQKTVVQDKTQATKPADIVKIAPPKPTSKTQVSALKDDDELVLTQMYATNPYKYGSDEYIKYQSFLIKPYKNHTWASYKSTQALTPAQKSAALQKLLDDGHVKLVDKAQKAAVQAAKDASPFKVVDLTQAKPVPKFEPADPKWQQAGGVLTVKNYGKEADDVKTLVKTRDDMGVDTIYSDNEKAVKSYTGIGYAEINRKLRKGEPGAVTPTVKRLDYLVGQSVVQKDTYLYRGIGSKGYHNNMPPPQDFVDMGFSSLSFNPAVSHGFSGVNDDGMRTMFRVRVPKGARGIAVARSGRGPTSMMRDEAEFVLERGSRFKYVGVTEEDTVDFEMWGSNYKVRVIEVEVVRADGSPF